MPDMVYGFILKHPRVSGVLAAILAIILGSFLWWRVVWERPQRVFMDMLSANLSAASVLKTVSAKDNGQSVSQQARLQMGGTNAADWLVTVAQTGSSVTTENIGTPTTGYIRYAHIDTVIQNNGKPFDFSKVQDVWGKSDGKTDPSLNHLFSQTLLDISSAPTPPIGNLPDSQRQNILTYMQTEKIFSPDYSKTKREKVDGHDVYTYQVAVQLGAYVRMMQAFAHYVGLRDLDTLDPSQYSTVPPITVTMSVDRASHQLVRVAYPGSGFAQGYSDWGLQTPITIPTHTIPTTELQNRIQALNSSAAHA
ncbi:MAG TPA: hypothetical protein VFT53_03905 [Candidatus Saccharimonadales bacterium]|nr:hypothetical protein [Candidatus Saccharimonadales bacterium]